MISQRKVFAGDLNFRSPAAKPQSWSRQEWVSPSQRVCRRELIELREWIKRHKELPKDSLN